MHTYTLLRLSYKASRTHISTCVVNSGYPVYVFTDIGSDYAVGHVSVIV